MNDTPLPDLEQVRSQLAAWRATKKGHPPIPASIWSAILALLDHYPLELLCRELKLKAAHVRKRQARSAPAHAAAASFLDLTPTLLAVSGAPASLLHPQPAYRLQIERADGCRLSLHLPARDAERLQALLVAFARS